MDEVKILRFSLRVRTISICMELRSWGRDNCPAFFTGLMSGSAVQRCSSTAGILRFNFVGGRSEKVLVIHLFGGELRLLYLEDDEHQLMTTSVRSRGMMMYCAALTGSLASADCEQNGEGAQRTAITNTNTAACEKECEVVRTTYLWLPSTTPQYVLMVARHTVLCLVHFDSTPLLQTFKRSHFSVILEKNKKKLK